MHWLLVRILRLHPDLPDAKRIAELLDSHLSMQNMRTELAYFESAAGRTFERPYGWAWLLELQTELARLGNPSWRDTVRPLATELAARMGRFVRGAPYPIRAGSHGNTAFACVLALDYARACGDDDLQDAILNAALRWYRRDHDAPLAYEPSLDDFLSPTLVEAVLMQQLLGNEVGAWLGRFFTVEPAALHPPVVTDRTDAKQSHLDGLCL